MIGLKGHLVVIVLANSFLCCHSALINYNNQLPCEFTEFGYRLRCLYTNAGRLTFKYSDSYKNVRRLTLFGRFTALTVSKQFMSLISIDTAWGLKHLSGADLPDSLVNLYIFGNRLKSLDLSKFPANLAVINANNNLINEIDLSTLPEALETLVLMSNNITSLNLEPLTGRKIALRLNVLDNPIVCTCSLVKQFVNALRYNRLHCQSNDEQSRCFQCKAGTPFENYHLSTKISPNFDAGVLDLISYDGNQQRCLQPF